MLLTKDNLVKFVREKKYVTPTTIAENFETTTMIGSAALSELSQAKLVKISNIKIGSTPYYYDPLQKQCLIELAEKHLGGHEKEIFNKLKQFEILNDNSLSIQEKLAVEKLKDFAMLLEVEHNERTFKFWIWYLRDLNETKKLIIEALNPKKEQAQKEDTTQKKEKIVRPVSSAQISQPNHIQAQQMNSHISKVQPEEEELFEESQLGKEREENRLKEFNSHSQNNIPKREFKQSGRFENQVEQFIEKYLHENYLKVESKHKTEKGVLYSTILRSNNLQIHVDCFYFSKKPNEADLISFYTSSQKPKVVFIENTPTKLFKLAENIENLTLVNI